MTLPRARCQVMGVVNVTPDSFSDGGAHPTVPAARDHALALVAAGADWLDVGGESTRPGAEPVSVQEELDRTAPVVEALATATEVPLSIDTRKPAVAEAAVKAGAQMWNDVTALRTPGALGIAAALDVPVVLMHMQGEPQTMQRDPHYEDVTAEVVAFLRARIDAAMAAGVRRERVLVDPGLGFGKTLAHNLALLAAIDGIARDTGAAVLVGASRKRFIHALDPSAEAAGDRLGGSLAAALSAAAHGASIIRVHDVRETVQALAVQDAISAARLANAARPS